jgi:hypothetical protein
MPVMKTTIALPDDLYDIVKHWASADGTSVNNALFKILSASRQPPLDAGQPASSPAPSHWPCWRTADSVRGRDG